MIEVERVAKIERAVLLDEFIEAAQAYAREIEDGSSWLELAKRRLRFRQAWRMLNSAQKDADRA